MFVETIHQKVPFLSLLFPFRSSGLPGPRGNKNGGNGVCSFSPSPTTEKREPKLQFAEEEHDDDATSSIVVVLVALLSPPVPDEWPPHILPVAAPEPPQHSVVLVLPKEKRPSKRGRGKFSHYPRARLPPIRESGALSTKQLGSKSSNFDVLSYFHTGAATYYAQFLYTGKRRFSATNCIITTTGKNCLKFFFISGTFMRILFSCLAL